MSTKISLFYDNQELKAPIHVYSELFDLWHVYMDIPISVSAGNAVEHQAIGIKFPLKLWCELVKVAGNPPMARYIDISPEDLRKEAEAAVEKRLRGETTYALGMGAVTLPAEVQIDNYIRYHTPPTKL